VVGDGGNREGHASYKNDDIEDWVHVRDCTTFGFGVFDVLNETHAKWRWMKNLDEGRVDVHDREYILNQYFL